MPALAAAVGAALVTGLAAPVAALTIQLDYRHDTFFESYAPARAALQAAAADISSAITTTLSPMTTDVFQATYQGTTATFNVSYAYTNPTTGAQVIINQPTAPTNVVTVFVGGRNLPGSTLGVGGPAAPGSSLSVQGTSSGLIPSVSEAAADVDSALSRGGGPTLGTATGSITLGNATAAYGYDYGATYGNLWFDVDTDNNGVQDSAAQFATYWHVDHTTPVTRGKSDLYSVALHELLHTLGVGSSASWDGLASGTTWLGSEAIAVKGSGASLVTADGNHIASGVSSTRITDGALQEVVMDPSITVGQRKSLTALDLAFLRDIGWNTITPVIVPPDPADFNGNGAVDGADLITWRNSFGKTAAGDANDDGVANGADFLIWQRNYTGSAPVGAVPEPGAATLAAFGALVILGLRKKLAK